MKGFVWDGNEMERTKTDTVLLLYRHTNLLIVHKETSTRVSPTYQ